MERIGRFKNYCLVVIFLVGIIRPLFTAVFHRTIDNFIWSGKFNDILDVVLFSYFFALVYINYFKVLNTKRQIRIKFVSAITTFLLGCASEVCQYYGLMNIAWLRYTYDHYDFIAYGAGFLLTLLFILTDSRTKENHCFRGMKKNLAQADNSLKI